MPVTTEVFTVPLGGWPRGLNRDAFELKLEPTETPDCLNVDIGLRGEFEVRDGYSENTTDSVGTDAVLKLAPWEPSSGTNLLIAVDDTGQVWQSADADPFAFAIQTADFNDAGTSNKRKWNVSAVILDDQMYLFSLRGNTWRWNGTTWTEITNTTLDETGTAASPQAPQAAVAVVHKDRIFAGNVLANGANSRSRIQISNTPFDNSGDAAGNRWTSTHFIDVNEDDGQEIRGLASYNGSLLIFKEHSTHVLVGYSPDDFQLYPIDDSVGTIAPNTVAYDESNLFFFDPSSGVYGFDGAKLVRIDLPIHNYLMDGLRRASAHRSTAVMIDGKYYLSVPWSGGGVFPTRTFVFDTRLGAWWEYDYGFNDVAEFSNKYWMAGPDDAAGVFTFQQGDTTDDGTGISWYLETIWFPPAEEQGMTSHRMRRADLWVEADSASLTVEMFVDGTESAVWTQNITADANRKKLPAYNGLWDIAKFKFSGTTS